MAKSRDDIKQLQRLLNRVSQLDGAVVRLGGAVFVTSFEAVIDPDVLLDALVAPGSPDAARAALQAGLKVSRDVRHVDARWTATISRDIKVLESAPGVSALVEQAPRLFRKTRVDKASVRALRRKLEALRTAMMQEDAPSEVADNTEPIAPAVGLIRCLHGDQAADAVLDTWRRSHRQGMNARSRARRRLQRLIERIDSAPAPGDDKVVEGLRRARTIPGRARRRRVLKLVAQALSTIENLPTHPAVEVDLPPDVDLIDEIQTIGEAYIARVPSTRSADYQRRLAHSLARYALMFPPRPETEPVVIAPDRLRRLEEAWRGTKATLPGAGLSLSEVIAWVSMRRTSSQDNGAVADWLRRGMPWELIERELHRGERGTLPPNLWPLEKAKAFLSWKARLMPVLEDAGIETALDPQAFNSLDVAKNEDLAVLAVALTGQRDQTGTLSPARVAEVLDATLGLFKRVPSSARNCLRDLDRSPAGLGRRTDPDLAAWLADDPLLDRYLHLRSLLGEPATLSASLRRDADRRERVQRQRAYLEAKSERTPAMAARLRRLSEQAGSVSAEWTRRRMNERIEEMTARAYRMRLDEALREVLRGAFGITVPKLTPAWWDVVRFYLRLDQNVEQLGSLLREATQRPGTFIPPRLPQNRGWMARASARMDVEAWCRAHRSPLELGPFKGVLAMEHDAIEVLRMGVPFETCLSIQGGCNAASAVINAVDVNKRVVYFRSGDGKPLARKLIAISSDFRLIGYQLYTAIGHDKELSAALDDYCAVVAKQCGVRLADRGVPEQLHAGFWYDDGVCPFGLESAVDVAPYLEHLDLPVPERASDRLGREAALFRARITGNVSLALGALQRWGGGPTQVAAETWLIEHLGVAQVERLAREKEALVPGLARYYGSRDPDSLVGAARRIPRQARDGEVFHNEFRALPAQPKVIRGMIDAAARLAQQSEHFDDHGLEHGTMYELPYFARGMSITEILLACDEAKPVWDWVVAQSESCAHCRTNATAQLASAAEGRYRQAPDPSAVGDCLSDPGRSDLAHRVALHIASIHPFPARQREAHSLSIFDTFEGKPRGAAWMRKKLRQLARFRPELAMTPTYLAAWLRQGEGRPISEEQVQQPQEAPFEALGDLAFHIPGLLDHLAQWGVPDSDPKRWAPGPWELYFHRRRNTPWRRALAREVLRDGPGKAEAWQHLSSIGAADSFAKLIEKMTSRELSRLPGPFGPGYDFHLLVDDVLDQVALDDRPRDEPIPRQLRFSSKRMDIELVRRAMRTVRRLQNEFQIGEGDGHQELLRALEVLRYPAVSVATWDVLLGELLTGVEGALAPSLIPAIRSALGEIPPHGCQGWSAETLVRIWQTESLRDGVVDQLPRWTDWAGYRRHCRCWREASIRLGMSMTGMEQRWLTKLVEGGTAEEVVANASEEVLESCIRLALEHIRPGLSIDLLEALPDAASVALWMRVFAEQPEARRAGVLQAAETHGANWDEIRIRLGWLRWSAQRAASS
jgi:hypothetical protein